MGCSTSTTAPEVNNGLVRRDSLLVNAVASGDIELVKMLLARTELDLSAEFNDALGQACLLPLLDIATVLVKDKRVDPSIDHNLLLTRACKVGRSSCITRSVPSLLTCFSS